MILKFVGNGPDVFIRYGRAGKTGPCSPRDGTRSHSTASGRMFWEARWESVPTTADTRPHLPPPFSSFPFTSLPFLSLLFSSAPAFCSWRIPAEGHLGRCNPRPLRGSQHCPALIANFTNRSTNQSEKILLILQE